VAMGAEVIVAENLTLTGSIGVDLGIFSLENMYKLIEWEEFTSWGTYKYHTADTEAFAERARHMYIRFRDNASLSRSKILMHLSFGV
jgi:protease IV